MYYIIFSNGKEMGVDEETGKKAGSLLGGGARSFKLGDVFINADTILAIMPEDAWRLFSENNLAYIVDVKGATEKPRKQHKTKSKKE